MINAPDILVKTVTARSPAKLIISGEHSVLYGQPALAMALDRYTTTTISAQKSSQIQFNLNDIKFVGGHTIDTLRQLFQTLQSNYAKYLQGLCPINTVLKQPYELLQYTVFAVLEKINAQLSDGMQIKINSSIPIGCGLGSSAAALTSTLSALLEFLDVEWEQTEYLNFCRQIENLQHGRSSGLDLHLTHNGGCVMFNAGIAQTRSTPKLPMFIVNTGTPLATTGECVSNVAKHFANLNLTREFGAVTNSIDAAITNNNLAQFQLGIKANHRLLQTIGVVPEQVASFISAIEQAGGAAKICGAGSIAGDNAGIVLVAAIDNLNAVASAHGYVMQEINVDVYGTKIL